VYIWLLANHITVDKLNLSDRLNSIFYITVKTLRFCYFKW